jgi:outer membrane protein OmpA-like peptidoglycan-associated protein
MTANRFIVFGFVIASVAALGMSSQAGAVPRRTPSQVDQRSSYQIVVVSRTARAVNYGHRSDATKINFEGTDLMPSARGEAKVWSKKGDTRIVVEFEGMENPAKFSHEYLTYVMWAISPEGRPVNLGEVLLGENHRSKLEVTTDLQAFAMIVTAEPYYAVRRPSNLVVLENAIRSDTVGTTQAVEAKYELVDKGGYIPTGYHFEPVILKGHLPLEFFEARNALRIAQSAGAENSAAQSYGKAAGLMRQADDMVSGKHFNQRSLISVSREAVEAAEDAREIAVKRLDADRAEYDRRSTAERAEADRRATAERTESDRKAAADRADSDRKAAADREAEARARTRNAEADSADAIRRREEAERQTREAREAADKSAQGQAEAERARLVALQQKKDAETESDVNRLAAGNAEQQRKQAVHEREELRARLLIQFNTILETRDTARGLIVNMSDVLFDTGQFTLRPLAREKLAKISGILLAYPTLKLGVEGNTDSVGGDDYNQKLSEDRAGSVRDFLVKQGVPTASLTARGYGKMQPTASNDTAEGRQQNRRVELVVSGDVIGMVIGVVPTAVQTRPN